MLTRPALGFLMETLYVVLQLVSVDAPHAASPDLDCRQLARPNKRVDLGDAHTEISRYIIEGEKSRLNLDLAIAGARRVPRHGATISAAVVDTCI